MLGYAIQNTSVVKVQLRTAERGSWKWQNAYRVQIVQCPLGEKPDCRRRGHKILYVPFRKIGGKRNIAEALRTAERYARDTAEQMGLSYCPMN